MGRRRDGIENGEADWEKWVSTKDRLYAELGEKVQVSAALNSMVIQEWGMEVRGVTHSKRPHENPYVDNNSSRSWDCFLAN